MGRHLIWSSKDGLFPDLWVGMWCSVWKRGLMTYDLKLSSASYTLSWNAIPLFNIKYLLNVCHSIQSYYPNLNQTPSSFQNPSIILGLCCQGWSLKLLWRQQIFWHIWPWNIPRSFSVCNICLSSAPICSLLLVVQVLTSDSPWMFFTCPKLYVW